jgi:hypothetical protein
MTMPLIYLGYNLSFLIEIYIYIYHFHHFVYLILNFCSFWCVLYTLGFCQTSISFKRLLPNLGLLFLLIHFKLIAIGIC